MIVSFWLLSFDTFNQEKVTKYTVNIVAVGKIFLTELAFVWSRLLE
jgi:hypothetical protein